jgi:hypothetical protein
MNTMDSNRSKKYIWHWTERLLQWNGVFKEVRKDKNIYSFKFSNYTYPVRSGYVIPESRSFSMDSYWVMSRSILSLQHKWINIINFFYSPTDAQVICLKTNLKFIFKFTLKQLRHVLVQSHHHQGVHYSCNVLGTVLMSILKLFLRHFTCALVGE